MMAFVRAGILGNRCEVTCSWADDGPYVWYEYMNINIHAAAAAAAAAAVVIEIEDEI